MTAEIAILNRRAVTFAADSAMTISRTGKTYNSADKIFEVSTNNPIGMMVYNQLDYMGMPLDVIIKDFRESPYCRKYPHVFETSDALFDCLVNEFSALGEDEDKHVATLTYSLFERIQRSFYEAVVGPSGSIGRGASRVPMRDLFLNVVNQYRDFFNDLAISECFWDLDIQDFLNRYDSGFNYALEDAFEMLPLDDSDKILLKQIAALALQRVYFSPVHTGFVFAGFGSDQLFPALQSFQFDGMIFVD